MLDKILYANTMDDFPLLHPNLDCYFMDLSLVQPKDIQHVKMADKISQCCVSA